MQKKKRLKGYFKQLLNINYLKPLLKLVHETDLRKAYLEKEKQVDNEINTKKKTVELE